MQRTHDSRRVQDVKFAGYEFVYPLATTETDQIGNNGTRRSKSAEIRQKGS